LKFSLQRAEGDHVTRANLAKGPEETVSVACEAYVPPLSRHWRPGKMADPSAQDLRRVAVKNDGFECKPRYLNLANSFANPREVRLSDGDIMGKFEQLNRLVRLGICNDVARVAHCE
jgi:hypothetical protein